MASQAAIQANVEGLEAARRALEKILGAESRAIRTAALPLIGQEAVRRTREKAPLDTGRLRRSYTYVVGDGYVDIGSNVEYAPYQELGTRFIDGTPHLRPAIEELRAVMPQIIIAAASKAGAGASRGGNIVRRTIGALT